MTDSLNPHFDFDTLDQLTGGALSAAGATERSARLRDWLASHPTLAQVQAVYDDMSHRDKGAAKVLREKLDELRRSKDQDILMVEWAAKGEALRDAAQINLNDALAWQRDAAKAGAPLSREPLAGLKTALAERVKAIEDLQHQTQVQREAAVLLAQRIEVLSTKLWQDALAQREALQSDLDRWLAQAQALAADAQWPSVDAKFVSALHTSTQQVQAVWTAFCEALTLTEAAAADTSAALPAVPAWSEQIRQARGEVLPPATDPTKAAKAVQVDATRTVKPTADKAAVDQKRLELAMQAEAMFKPVDAKTINEKAANEQVADSGDSPTHVPAMGGRKMQETLRGLREQWKKIDKEAAPNPALWKRFDTACNRAHAVVDAWLKEARAQTAAHKAQRLALIEEVQGWTATHAHGPDWKAVARQLHQFAQRWRESGHLSEKMFAELQPQWKAAIHAAHEPLEAAQKASLARRHALIAEAQALGAASSLRVDAVKALQQRWQEEAHTVVLDRKHEQKLWDAFREPIDQAFARKSSVREQSQTALTPHDKAVLDAAKALEAATTKGDAVAIRSAMQALEQAARGEVTPQMPTTPTDASQTTQEGSTEEEMLAKPKAAPRPLVAVRGDDRPGQKRAQAAPTVRAREAKMGGKFTRDTGREGLTPRGPRLGDVAFRAQRHALESAQDTLRRLAAHAHGEVLTQLMLAWEKRDAAQLPSAQAIGSKLTPAQRTQWSHALSAAASGAAATPLLRLEVAADLPSPAAHQDARRALQLQMLTRRNDPSPQMTWAADVAEVLGGAYDEAAARRLQAVLKVLLKR